MTAAGRLRLVFWAGLALAALLLFAHVAASRPLPTRPVTPRDNPRPGGPPPPVHGTTTPHPAHTGAHR